VIFTRYEDVRAVVVGDERAHVPRSRLRGRHRQRLPHGVERRRRLRTALRHICAGFRG
jgi:hypothetical protein